MKKQRHLRAYETGLRRLPATALDSLETWAENCNEPGFLARVLLLGNGREVMPDCGGGSARPGLYFCRVVDASGLRLAVKPVVSR
ncbi:MAG: hypothetical protein JNJ90_06420 [Saprospiraceae bacterium]|jgi:hypothetical protein|nr:hypothetical protein [Saprospiraceae bacterium]